MQLTATQLRQIAIYATASHRATYRPLLNAAFTQYQINTPARIAAFLAQIIRGYIIRHGTGAWYKR